MMRKLSQPMIDTLLDAWSNDNILRGKTNTVAALMDRDLAYTWINPDGGPNQVRLNGNGVALAEQIMTEQSLTATINDDDTPEVLRERVEVARMNHFAVATSDDREVSFYLSDSFVTTKTALLDAIRAAYPDVDPLAVYALWADNNESIAYNVDYHRREVAEVEAMRLEEERYDQAYNRYHTAKIDARIDERIAEMATTLDDAIDQADRLVTDLTTEVVTVDEADLLDTLTDAMVDMVSQGVARVQQDIEATDTYRRQVDANHARGRKARGKRRKATRRAVQAHARARRRRSR